jgi:hypothetical protein
VTKSWFEPEVLGTTLTMKMGERSYLTKAESATALATEGYYSPNLLGGSVSYDVDVSGADCGCVDTFNLVQMPGHNKDGSIASTDGFGYCDAAHTVGVYCPEFDFMEANLYGFNSHTWRCGKPDENMYYDFCTKENNCHLDVHDYGDNYGPGNATIDSTKPFHVETNFIRKDDTLDYYTVELTQEGRSLLMSSGNCDTGNFGYELADGMAFMVSTRGSDDNIGLEHGKCKGACDAGAIEVISNIRIYTGK